MRYIACGDFHSLAISEKGKLFGWGEAKSGQLGLGKMRNLWVPTKIKIYGNDSRAV